MTNEFRLGTATRLGNRHLFRLVQISKCPLRSLLEYPAIIPQGDSSFFLTHQGSENHSKEVTCQDQKLSLIILQVYETEAPFFYSGLEPDSCCHLNIASLLFMSRFLFFYCISYMTSFSIILYHLFSCYLVKIDTFTFTYKLVVLQIHQKNIIQVILKDMSTLKILNTEIVMLIVKAVTCIKNADMWLLC